MTSPEPVRIDSASRVIHASPHAIYRALLDPKAWIVWLPPPGMTARIERFDAREGGGYRMALTHEDAAHATPGKTSDHTDVIEGTFVKLAPSERVVQSVRFVADDPAFAQPMKMTWAIVVMADATKVTIVCENVPAAISKADHDQGLNATLENLAAYLEGRAA